jgi:hypothetical protein
MSSKVDCSKEKLAWSSLWGVGRGIFVHSLIYPLEVIKIRQQCSEAESKSSRVALALLRQEGIAAFYKGLAPQLLKTSIRQVWCWPMMTGMPSALQRFQIENLSQQALTGLSIATIDAVTTPLDRAKIIAAFSGTNKLSFKDIYREGWRGLATNWSKLSVNWVTFLTTQKYLRDQFSVPPNQSLSFSQLTTIGVEVALIVSLISAPFDIANTLKQAKNLSPSHLLNRREIFKLYRGWPLNALSLSIHNIASVTVIDKLGRI